MSSTRYLLDTSALFRLTAPGGSCAWDDEIAAGLMATCPLVELEFLYSARSLADRLAKERLLRVLFTWVPIPDRAFDRAAEVQQRLTEIGEHRSAGAIDLVIAATAEAAGLSVLAEDRDYLAIARVTGQSVQLVGATGRA